MPSTGAVERAVGVVPAIDENGNSGLRASGAGSRTYDEDGSGAARLLIWPSVSEAVIPLSTQPSRPDCCWRFHKAVVRQRASDCGTKWKADTRVAPMHEPAFGKGSCVKVERCRRRPSQPML